MKKYINKLKSNKKALYISIAILILFVGTTFAYVAAQLSGGDFKLFNLNADTTDQLEFNVDKDLSIHATQFNFAEGAGNLSDQAVATARLKANSTKNTATYTYNVYLLIDKNEFIYTTSDKKTEILLQVTDPNGNNLTELSGLKYDSTLQGVDITEVNDELIRIASNYEITSNSSKNYTEQTWVFKVTFINLDTNQKENAGKTLNGKVMIQKNKVIDLSIAANSIPETYGALATMNCIGNDALYNYKYNEINVKNVIKPLSNCALNFSENSNKSYLNDYILDLLEKSPTQGMGSLVHEAFIWGDYNNTTTLAQEEYKKTSQYFSSSASSSSGTTITDAFQYNGTEWVSQPGNMSSDKYYHIRFRLNSGSYYQLCYELSSGSINNQLYVYKGQIQHNEYISASSSNKTSGCIDIGQVTSLTYITIAQRAYSTISTLKFSIKRANSTKEIDTGYRYEGENPNNYVWFNNELWRIIGVFDKSSHGQDGLNLVKIVRNESIGGLVWDKSNVNNWNSASLKLLLNNEYLNSTNGTNSENCYGYSTTSKSKCDYRRSGIKDSYRSMIKEVTWYLGGYSSNSTTGISLTTDEMYGYERSTANKIESNPASINAKVGLMYASDYGYAVPVENCVRSKGMYSYNNESCTLNNWLYSGQAYATITPESISSSGVLNVIYNGNMVISSANNGYGVRPTLYLNENIYVLDGTGSETDPFIIGMQEI